VTDLYGGQPLPAPVAPPYPQILDPRDVVVVDQPMHDALLYYVGTFLCAVANAEYGDAWGAMDPGNPLPVRSLFLNDPSKRQLSTNDLPAFFLWRQKPGKPRQLADGWRIRDTVLHLAWVLPGMQDDTERERDVLIPLIHGALDDFLDEQRHPAWVVPGDTTPHVVASGGLPALGSWLGAMRDSSGRVIADDPAKQAQRLFMHLFPGEWSRVDVTVDPVAQDEKPPAPLEAYLQTFDVRERLVRDPLRRGVRLQGLTQTIQTRPTDPLGPWPAQSMRLK
jgi:hypothetical protein